MLSCSCLCDERPVHCEVGLPAPWLMLTVITMFCAGVGGRKGGREGRGREGERKGESGFEYKCSEGT